MASIGGESSNHTDDDINDVFIVLVASIAPRLIPFM